MDPLAPLLLFGSFGVLMVLGFPIAAALGISSVLTIVAFGLAPLELVPQQLFSATDSWTLLAVPFFILAGNLLAKTAISERLVHLARVIVGQLPAGLGAILIPAMEKAGYDKRSAAALIAAGGGIGIIIPPSIALLIHGVVANAPVTKLFIAGILPGLLVGVSLFVVSYLLFGRDPNVRAEKRGTPREVAGATRDAFWGLLAPLIILGGIYGGIFTATEAATVAVVNGVVVGFFVHRDLRLSDLPPVVKALEIDLVHFGVIMTVNMAIGQITPPVGVNLFVACGIARIPMKEISRAVVPMVLAQTAAFLVVSFWPDLSLWLSRFMR